METIQKVLLVITIIGAVNWGLIGLLDINIVAATACGNPDTESKTSIESDFHNAGYKAPNWGIRHAVCGDLSPLCFHISSNYNHKVNTKQLKVILCF